MGEDLPRAFRLVISIVVTVLATASRVQVFPKSSVLQTTVMEEFVNVYIDKEDSNPTGRTSKHDFYGEWVDHGTKSLRKVRTWLRALASAKYSNAGLVGYAPRG